MVFFLLRNFSGYSHPNNRGHSTVDTKPISFSFEKQNQHSSCSTTMLLFISMLFLIRIAVVSADIVKRPNGYFITGRGCGVTNPIRYLNSMPKDIENYGCSFIDLQKSRPLRAG